MTDHAHSDLAHKGDASLDRMLFFSDGVFAIAITLLSIELHPPHDWDSTFAGLIRESWPMLSAFALSFLVIGVFWNAHRRLFLRMTRFTNGVFLLNLALLGGIVLMPYATTLLYQPASTVEAFAIYLGLVSVIGVLQGAIYGYAAFVADAIRPVQHWTMRLSALLMMALMPIVCCALSLAFFQRAGPVAVAGLVAVLLGLIGFRRYAARKHG